MRCLALIGSLLTTVTLAPFVSAQPVSEQPVSAQESLPQQVLRLLADDEIQQALRVTSPHASAQAVKQQINLDAAFPGMPAAAGAIYRNLAQLSTDEQYEILRDWSLPTESPKDAASPRDASGTPPYPPHVRMLTSFVPQSSPPKVFARSIGERPRDSTFASASVGEVPGLFCSGWMLVSAADDIGRLSRLTTELEELAEKQIPGADILLWLARIKSSRSDLEGIDAELAKRFERIATPEKTDATDFLLAVAALQREALQSNALKIIDALADDAMNRPALLRSHLRIARAIGWQVTAGESPVDVLLQNRLKYWVPADSMTAAASRSGSPPAVWLTHEDHVLHLGGSVNPLGPLADALLCRFPLQGDFEFGCGVQCDAGAEGGLLYGGLNFETRVADSIFVRDAGGVNSFERKCPFIRHDLPIVFNRLSIMSEKQKTAFSVNRHPMWIDPLLPLNSPWVGMHGKGAERPVFRNLRVTGTPTIPQEIALSEATDLRGWSSSFFAETQPRFLTATATGNAELPRSAPIYDWDFKNGEIQAGKRTVKEGEPRQSLLRYQRPLLEGETIAYEFFHEAGEPVVHPALGRIAFLIDTSGVRIRWITDGPLDWTGLKEDNNTLEPLSRRGPRQLTLKPEWNQASLAIVDGKASLSLNGELIYQRPIDDGVQTFGFYRDPSKTSVRIRNVKMTGDWPQELPADFQKNPAALRPGR